MRSLVSAGPRDQSVFAKRFSGIVQASKKCFHLLWHEAGCWSPGVSRAAGQLGWRARPRAQSQQGNTVGL